MKSLPHSTISVQVEAQIEVIGSRKFAHHNTHNMARLWRNTTQFQSVFGKFWEVGLGPVFWNRGHIKTQMYYEHKYYLVQHILVSLYIMYITTTYEGPPKPPTIRNRYTRTLILDMIMKLSGTKGVTQKTMTFDIHVWIWRHSSGKLISARNEASKSIQKLCAKSKRYHADNENERTSKIRKWKAARNDDQNDDWTMTIFLVSESLQTHPHTESSTMTSLLVRNYSFFIAAAAFSFAAACSVASATAST